MCPAGDLGPNQGILCVKNLCVDLLQRISAQIVVAVTGGAEQAGLTYLTVLHRLHHLQLIVFCHLIDPGKTFL